MSRRLDAGIVQKSFNPETEKERVWMTLDRDEYVSVFGDTNTESVLAEDIDNLSVISKSLCRRYKLGKSNLANWKLNGNSESQMKVELKQRQVEVEQKLEEGKTKVKLMQAQMGVKVAAARVRTYNHVEGGAAVECNSPVPVIRMCLAMNLSGQLGTIVTSQCHDASQGPAATAAFFF